MSKLTYGTALRAWPAYRRRNTLAENGVVGVLSRLTRNEMINDSDMRDQVHQFLNEIAGVELDALTNDMSLEIDLDISGDDASELIVAFAERFKVDVSKFRFDDHFHSECQ